MDILAILSAVILSIPATALVFDLPRQWGTEDTTEWLILCLQSKIGSKALSTQLFVCNAGLYGSLCLIHFSLSLYPQVLDSYLPLGVIVLFELFLSLVITAIFILLPFIRAAEFWKTRKQNQVLG